MSIHRPTIHLLSDNPNFYFNLSAPISILDKIPDTSVGGSSPTLHHTKVYLKLLYRLYYISFYATPNTLFLFLVLLTSLKYKLVNLPTAIIVVSVSSDTYVV